MLKTIGKSQTLVKHTLSKLLCIVVTNVIGFIMENRISTLIILKYMYRHEFTLIFSSAIVTKQKLVSPLWKMLVPKRCYQTLVLFW